jgi:hypothetical protein
MVILYTPTGENKWDIRIGGEKVGHISKKRRTFVATITRSVHPDGLDAICAPGGFVAELNGMAA